MNRLLAVTGGAVIAACALPATLSARAAYCSPLRDAHAEVFQMSTQLGCGTARAVALKTVESGGGYFKSSRWYCRWGEGGTIPIKTNDHVYYSGFCAAVPGFRQANFLGRRLR